MLNGNKNTRKIVKKKNLAGKPLVEEEEPNGRVEGMQKVGGYQSQYHHISLNPFSISDIGISSIKDRVQRIQMMSKGFFKTPIWDPQQRREDLHKWKIFSFDSLRRKGLGFLDNQQIWGNDKKGKEWVDEQQRRNKFDISKKQDDKKFSPQDIIREKIIYIEASPSEKKLEQLRQKGQKFTDNDFPPNDESLDGGQGRFRQPIHWRKISQKMSSPSIFKGKVEPQDIIQGMLGDCYFLAGLAALAERPDRIYDLFLLKEDNQLLYYSVRILFRGKWRTVDLDEYLPYSQSCDAPAFSKSKDSELWVLLLQKAWAKIYKNYHKIEAGFPQQALHDLTGAPIKHIFLRHSSFDAQNEWNYLLEASEKEYSMVASSQAGSDTQMSVSGVVQGHAYTFLNATYLKFNSGPQNNYQIYEDKVVQLRNPWGKGEFKGRWADHDYTWDFVDQSEKRRVGYNPDKNDGIFFMAYNDFLKEFNVLTIAQINDNASYVYESYRDPNCEGVYFTIDIIKPSQYSFHVDKTPERHVDVKGYKYPLGELGLRRIDTGNYALYQGLLSRRRSLFRKYQLEPGRYVAYARIEYRPEFEKDFEVNLAIYSDYACDIRIATREEAQAYERRQDVGWSPSQENILNSVPVSSQKSANITQQSYPRQRVKEVNEEIEQKIVEKINQGYKQEQQNGNQQEAKNDTTNQQQKEQVIQVKNESVQNEAHYHQFKKYAQTHKQQNQDDEHQHHQKHEQQQKHQQNQQQQQQQQQQHHQHHAPAYIAPQMIGGVNGENEEELDRNEQKQRQGTSMQQKLEQTAQKQIQEINIIEQRTIQDGCGLIWEISGQQKPIQSVQDTNIQALQAQNQVQANTDHHGNYQQQAIEHHQRQDQIQPNEQTIQRSADQYPLNTQQKPQILQSVQPPQQQPVDNQNNQQSAQQISSTKLQAEPQKQQEVIQVIEQKQVPKETVQEITQVKGQIVQVQNLQQNQPFIVFDQNSAQSQQIISENGIKKPQPEQQQELQGHPIQNIENQAVEEVIAEAIQRDPQPPVQPNDEYILTQRKITTTTRTKSRRIRTTIDTDGNQNEQVIEDVEQVDEKVEFLEPQEEEQQIRKFSKSQKSEDNIDSVFDEAPIEELQDQMRLIEDIDENDQLQFKENLVVAEKAESSPGNSPKQSRISIPKGNRERGRTQDFRNDKHHFNYESQSQEPIREAHEAMEESQKFEKMIDEMKKSSSLMKENTEKQTEEKPHETIIDKIEHKIEELKSQQDQQDPEKKKDEQ